MDIHFEKQSLTHWSEYGFINDRLYLANFWKFYEKMYEAIDGDKKS